ncbi:hypothetical protein F5Y04DRAFT_291177 [Hypomontagnella monticulosa]|nr:hypothetical protein F5Y04DRAFT_291177 [Hypomontagnella monticulosa]
MGVTVRGDPDGTGEMVSPGTFTGKQLDAIIVLERLGASLSIAGVLLIFISYAMFKRLRTVPNTFIVFASSANLVASVACLISYSGVLQGPNSQLCQAQGFLFELFMQSDPWWSFAMAINVFMVFFFSANPKSFLRYWWAYCIVCYGIPTIPAIWLLFIHGDDGQGTYGDATIWCWIDKDWTNLRIFTYYLPIWCCCLLSACIYAAVGYHVFKQRNQLRNLSLSNPTQDSPTTRDSGEKNLFANAAVMGSINREVVQVTTVNSSTAYHLEGPSTSGATPSNWFDGPANAHSSSAPAPASSRFQTIVTQITADPKKRKSVLQRLCSPLSNRAARWRARFRHMDPVKLAYLRTSFVFAISVGVTWLPSSINRVHDMVSSGRASFGLNLASALVLPLQGTWNAVIYFSTSWNAVREELRACAEARRGIPRGHHTAAAVRDERERERGIKLARFDTAGHSGHGHVDDAGSELSAPSTLGGNTANGGTIRVIRGGSLSSV